ALGLARGGRGARAAGVAAVAGVACSRVVIGVHHASDVVAGIGVGAIADRVARLALDRVSRR
ncbi:MAG: hypothetical protein JJT89_09565, partial [Nitriliruptoraceae bacterium]|nr:hypothetical protein [Nitriliruptoraceae bacterium]